MAYRPTVPCGLCGDQTPSVGTQRCDRCWELETLVLANPDLAMRILFTMFDDWWKKGRPS